MQKRYKNIFFAAICCSAKRRRLDHSIKDQPFSICPYNLNSNCKTLLIKLLLLFPTCIKLIDCLQPVSFLPSIHRFMIVLEFTTGAHREIMSCQYKKNDELTNFKLSIHFHVITLLLFPQFYYLVNLFRKIVSNLRTPKFLFF